MLCATCPQRPSDTRRAKGRKCSATRAAALYPTLLYTLSKSKTTHGQWDSGQRITIGSAVSPGGWGRKSGTNQAGGAGIFDHFWAGLGWAGLGICCIKHDEL